ncbi:MAG: hypothetical protein HY720_15175, partial [Planctomycetes bacterium]|nr:hypothetical protein [Planctomycetota bacterium]
MLAGASGHAQEVNPYPRERIGSSTLHEWTFDGGREGWSAVHDSRLAVSDGVLSIESTGGDPYVHGPEIEVEAPALLRLRLRCRGAGGGQVFWLTRESPTWKEESSARFELVHDGEWRDYEVPIETSGTLSRIRLDPGLAPGVVEADRIAIEEYRLHPLEIVRVEVGPASDTALVRNHSDRPIGIHMGRCGGTAPAGGIGEVSHVDTSHGSEPFEAVSVQVTAGDLPPLSRTVFLFWPDVESEWLVLESPELLLKLAPDGSGARIERKGKLVAVLAPILRCGDLNFRGVWTKVEDRLDMRNDLATVQISLAGSEIRVSIEARGPVEGPVLRALGPLEQGLFAGIEYLGKGECSSSNLDIETPEHVRFAPDPLDVTMPLMAVATPESWAGMTWDDPSLGPVFASPNFFDGTPDHRMALRGQQIEATIGLGEGTIEEAILWAARRRGLPPLPEAPRDAAAQRALCLSSLEGPLRDERGWGHCAEPNWKRAPYADHASTIWRLTGKAPELASLAPGGSHIINDAIWFVTGRAREWLESRTAGAHAILAGQREDGSFRYSGPYQRGHFEDTASGFCAQKAVVLLEHARATGDPESLEGGLRALEYMKRFRTPRGAQTWELSLHTPDILASAYLVWAYVLGFELAG